MNASSFSLKQHGLLVSLMAVAWATACGGSFSGGAGGAGSAGAAGSGAGSAGTGAVGGNVCECPLIVCEGISVTLPGDCCPTCEPAGGAGGVSGSGGVGGSCAGVACPAIACGNGYHFENLPGQCCGTCVPDETGGSGGVGGCAAVDCALPKCQPGWMLQQQPDSCCPVCVPGDACDQGQAAYTNLRDKLLAQPGAVACKTEKDCALLQGNAQCGEFCSGLPVNAAAAQSINSQLSSFAQDNCSTCATVYPPCAAPPPPACLNGQCTNYVFAGDSEPPAP